MSGHTSPSDAQEFVIMWLTKKAKDELKALLETKHLYQKVDVDPNAYAVKVVTRIHPNFQAGFSSWMVHELPKKQFVLEPHLNAAAKIAAQIKPGISLILPHLSLFCKFCERREAFAPVWHTELIGGIRAGIAAGTVNQIALPDDLQVFSLVYQCQRCLSTPESFLVRRAEWILTLHGRSPMEQVEVPNYVPKSESHLYRDAVIAFNSGKTLAALFYLRTFIEQFARRITGLKGRKTGDEILDAYYKTLPEKQAGHLPSLREWYDKLSEAVHSASEDAALFEAAKPAIEEHFDFRRLFKIEEPQINDATSAKDSK